MTEREQMVRERIARVICDKITSRVWDWASHAEKELHLQCADQILNLTDPEGNRLLGIIDPHQSKPENPYDKPKAKELLGEKVSMHRFLAYKHAQQDMAGFVKLIDSGKG